MDDTQGKYYPIDWTQVSKRDDVWSKAYDNGVRAILGSHDKSGYTCTLHDKWDRWIKELKSKTRKGVMKLADDYVKYQCRPKPKDELTWDAIERTVPPKPRKAKRKEITWDDLL